MHSYFGSQADILTKRVETLIRNDKSKNKKPVSVATHGPRHPCQEMNIQSLLEICQTESCQMKIYVCNFNQRPGIVCELVHILYASFVTMRYKICWNEVMIAGFLMQGVEKEHPQSHKIPDKKI